MKTFDVQGVLSKIKKTADLNNLGMILIHNGVVRGTSADGKPVESIDLSYDREKLDNLLKEINQLDFVENCTIWVNEGKLKVGEDIMWVVLAGNRRKNLLPTFEKVIETLKTQIVREVEQ